MKNLGKLTVLTTRQFNSPDVESIPIEDLGTRDLIPSKFQSIRYTYELASTYIHKINIPQDEFILLIDANYGLDTGFTIRILEEITNASKIPNTTLIIRAVSIDADEQDRARFYGLAKTIFLYDVFLNSINPGCFKYVFIDASASLQVFKRIVELLSRVRIERNYSLLHVKMKRFILPVAESLLLAKLLGKLGELKESAEEYSYIVAVLNMILDRAPTDLWYTARRVVDKIKVSYRSYKSSREGLDKVAVMIGELLKTVNEGKKFTQSLIDLKSFFETTIRGGFTGVLQSEGFIKSIDNVLSVESSSLPDLYSQARIDHYEDYYRVALVSKDLSIYVKKGALGLIEDAVGEIMVTETYGIPIDYRGDVNKGYLSPALYEAYINKGGLSLDHVHPHKIRFGSTDIDSSTIFTMQPINYRGLMRAIEEKRGDRYRFLEEILGLRLI